MSKETQKWRAVKAKIVVVHGTIAKAAATLGCSTEGMKKAVQGRCPGIARKMRDAGLLAA